MEKIGALILAAGKGTRMYPLTLAVPKVLLPIGGMPLLQWHINWIKAHGIHDIAINLHHGAEKIETFLGDGSRFDINVHYLMESQLLGTALSARRMSHNFGDVQVVVYGDVLSAFNLSAMVDFHINNQAMITLALFNKQHRTDVGGVEISSGGRCLSFEERPSESAGYSWANGGVYVVNKAVFNMVEENGFSDFGHDVLPRAIGMGLAVYGYTLGKDDYLLDIGTFERYAQANDDALRGKIKTLLKVN